MGKHVECRYCDLGFPTKNNGDTVCGGCGAEWAAAAIIVESNDEFADDE